MRPLIQYDLDEPPPPGPSASAPARPHPNARRPPAKKRRRNHAPPAAHKSKAPLHWDDPGCATVGVIHGEESGASVAVSYEDDAWNEDMEAEQEGEGGEGEEEEEEEEESRPLTHEEIWDDSALIDAWHSAEAEYKAYHGMSKDWKTEPVKRSPLWYNKPYTAPPPKPGPGKSKSCSRPENDEPDTAPLDFSTFVPTHDPSLASAGSTSDTAAPSATAATAPFFVPPPSTTTVSRDEAFNNALSAMYWSGYWTAVYHSQSQVSSQAEAKEEDGIRADGDGEEEDQDLVPSQR